MSSDYPIRTLCAKLAVSRCGYYAWVRYCDSVYRDSAHARRDRELRTTIAVVHQQSQEIYGCPRITVELRTQGDKAVGRHRVAHLMRQE